jgi:hypothetical protein
MKTSHTLRALSLSAAAFAALAGAQAANAQSQSAVSALQARSAALVTAINTIAAKQTPVVVQPTPAAKSQSGVGLKKGLEMMATRRPAEAGELPRNAKANSGVVGELDVGVMSAAEISLTLADGNVITARLQRSASDAKFNSQSWVGTIDGAEGSVVVLTKAKGVVTGFANYENQILEIQPTAGGKHVLYTVDESKLPKGEPVRAPKLQGDAAVATVADSGIATTTAATSVVQDVLVLYTAATANRYGQASIESQIQSAIQSANQAYQNSLVGITLNLVGMQQSTIVEQSNMDSTVNVLQADSGVARLRDQVGADMVMLVSENSDYCGLANLMTSNSTSFAPYAFGVVYSSCLSNQSLAHELGHQQGLMHDRASSSGWAGVYAYSYGYGRCTSDSTAYRDVMSYPCGSAPRVLLFSNPNVTWNGFPAGISYESDPANSAEAARSLNNTAATVAAFRGGATTAPPASAPAAPTGLGVQSASYNKVSLAWTDNATNESGFKIERSTNGTDFVVISTLAADTRSYTDSSVVAQTTYYFRVQAYNSTGPSAYSSTINVTTPDQPAPPPPPPSSVGATDGKDGTANVYWNADTSSTMSFEVRREKWDTRKLAWGSATTAATVPASVLTFVDSTGAGQYRYSVRAVNTGGASSYTGPAQVTVTSTSTSTSTSPVKGKGPVKK